MAALDIPPHSRRLSRWAVVALSALAAGGFGVGLAHQFEPSDMAPFPAASHAARAADGIPEARPAPDMQIATAPPPRHRARPEDQDDQATSDTAPADAAASTGGPAATDASATAPETAPGAGPETAPGTAPTTAPAPEVPPAADSLRTDDPPT